MRRQNDSTSQINLTLIVLLSLLGLTSCGSTEQPSTAPTTFITAPGAGTVVAPGATAVVTGPVAVVPVDSSASVVGTDLLAAAQNRVRELVQTMPVGGKVVVVSLNHNVGAMCDPLIFGLDRQNNPDLELQSRQATVQLVDQKFPEYIACSTDQDLGGTELFGGLQEVFAYYPTAEVIEVYTDGCDTVTVRGLCAAKNLRDPHFTAKVLAKSLATTTPLAPGVQITFHGIGRNTKLPADAIASLRQLIGAWTQRAGVTPFFTAS